jgi:hypothetical protein
MGELALHHDQAGWKSYAFPISVAPVDAEQVGDRGDGDVVGVGEPVQVAAEGFPGYGWQADR